MPVRASVLCGLCRIADRSRGPTGVGIMMAPEYVGASPRARAAALLAHGCGVWLARRASASCQRVRQCFAGCV
jgi:hypothetical protein